MKLRLVVIMAFAALLHLSSAYAPPSANPRTQTEQSPTPNSNSAARPPERRPEETSNSNGAPPQGQVMKGSPESNQAPPPGQSADVSLALVASILAAAAMLGILIVLHLFKKGLSNALEQNRTILEKHELKIAMLSANTAPPIGWPVPFDPLIPSFSSVSPSEGKPGGGTKITIKGENFHHGARVFFDLIPAEGESIASDKITAITPPPRIPGTTVDVMVINPGGSPFVRRKQFRYLPELKFTGLDPVQGKAGETVTLRGEGFWVAEDGGIKVWVGHDEVPAERKSDKEITIMIPSNAPPGKAKIKVQNAGVGDQCSADFEVT